MRRNALRLLRPAALRVDRYTMENPPADGSRYAYVLDMVVESDNTRR